MTVAFTDYGTLPNDPAFQLRVAVALAMYGAGTVMTEPTSTPSHTARVGLAKMIAIQGQLSLYAQRFAIGVAMDPTVIEQATTQSGGSAYVALAPLTVSNLAVQAALVTDAAILNAVGALYTLMVV